MDLVERDDVVNLLYQLLTDSRRGRGRLAVLNGAAGSGKTALLHAFTEWAATSGATLLGATGSHTERTLPLGVVSQIFQDAPTDPETAAHVARVLGAGSSAPVPPDLAVEAGSGLHDLCGVLLKLAEETPLVIAIDDVEYADLASLQWLLYLSRRLRSARILVVLNECAGTRPVDPRFHAELLRQPYCHRIELPLLSVRGVGRMLGEDPAAVPERSRAAACHALTGGNPLLVKALMEDLRTYGWPATSADPPLGVDTAFGNAVRTLLYRGDPVFLTVAQAIAVLDEASSPAMVGRLVRLDPRTVAQVEHALTAAGLLLDGRFRSLVARAAVLASLANENGRYVHHRAARQLHRDGAQVTAVAQRLLATGRIEEPWAVPVLTESAGHALRDGQVQLAVQQLRLAYDGCADEPQRARIRALLANAEWQVSPSAVLRHLPELSDTLRDGSLRGREAVAAVRYLLWYGYDREARDVLDHFRTGRDGLDPETATEVDSAKLWMSLCYPPLTGGAPPGSVLPGAAGLQLQAVGALVGALTGNEAATVSAERVLQQASLNATTMGPASAAVLALIYADRLGTAATWSATLLQAAAGGSAPVWTGVASALRAEVALRQGDLAAAEDHARSALASMSAQSWGVALGCPLATLIRAMTAMGRHDDAAELVAQPVPEAMFRTPFGLHYLEARGYHRLAENRLYAALGDFEICGALMRQWQLDVPALVPWRAGAARAYLLLGQRGAAGDLVTEQLALLDDGAFRARGIALRLLAAIRELPHRPAILRQAADVFEAGTARLELAYALADLSVAHRQLGEFADAEAVLRSAHQVADECGAQNLRHRLAAELAAAPPAPRPATDPADIDALSEAEQRVATLAADGLTNREIAGKLYITVSTVEQHLTRVYRKLHVNRRSELRYRLRLDVSTGRARTHNHVADPGAHPRLGAGCPAPRSARTH